MEAVRGTDVDEFRETLQAGIDELRGSGAEVVLMNMQFSRETDTMIHFGPYLVAMRELANVNDVPLFRRHGIMRHWAESDLLDLRTKDVEKRRQLAAKLYDCIGNAIADFVTRGAAASKAAVSPWRRPMISASMGGTVRCDDLAARGGNRQGLTHGSGLHRASGDDALHGGTTQYRSRDPLG